MRRVVVAWWRTPPRQWRRRDYIRHFGYAALVVWVFTMHAVAIMSSR